MGNSNKKSPLVTTEKDELSSIMFVSQEPSNLLHFFQDSPTNNISSLSLQHCHIGPKGTKMMTKCLWPHLTNLKLYECRLGNAGIIHLVKSQTKNLKILNIVGNGITDEGFSALKRGDWRLKYLTVNQNYGLQKRPNTMNDEGWKSIWSMKIQKIDEIKPTKKYSYYNWVRTDLDLIQ